MDLFLIHSLVLLWSSTLAARRLLVGAADRILATWVLAWGNIVLASLLLSAVGRLGQPAWFLVASSALGIAACLLAACCRAEDPGPPEAGSLRLGLTVPFLLTLLPIALALGRVAWAYQPNAQAALSHELPRALFYLGQGSLGHFDTGDLRQVFHPFNGNLLQLFGLVYRPPLPCLNAWNVAAWIVAGFAVHRACRLAGLSPGSALAGAWFALISAPVLIQGATSSVDLPASISLLSGLVFAVRYRRARLTRDGLLAGLALGLAFGSTLAFTFLLIPLLLVPWRPGGRWPWQGLGACWHERRTWLVPAIPALLVGLPPVAINLVETGRWMAWHPDGPLGTGHGAAFQALGAGLRQWIPSLDSAPADNAAWFGWPGLLLLASAGLCLARPRRTPGLPVGLAWVGLGWLLALLALQPATFRHPGGLIPAFLLLTPCLAAALDLRHRLTPGLSRAAAAFLLFAATGALVNAASVLLFNPSRPLAALLDRELYAPGLPSLPLLVGHRLADQRWINVDSDATDAPVLPFLVLGRNQRFTAHAGTVEAAYNLISRAAGARQRAYEHGDLQPAYVIMPVPTKATGGVEFLGTVGVGAAARDYFGLEPRTHPAVLPANRCLLVTVRRLPADPRVACIAVAGLDPRDGLRLDIVLEADDGTSTRLATLAADGRAEVALAEPFHLLHFKAVQVGDEAVAGAAALPYRIPPAASPPGPVTPSSSANSIFVTDLVLSMPPHAVRSEGLLPVEGPFPQWDLPYLRWATVPVMRLWIPPTKGLARVQLSFSIRLHVRERAVLEIWLNGERVETFRMEGRDQWFDQVLDLTPGPGQNLVEFRDASRKGRPDWLGYLERNPDVKAHVLSQPVLPEQGAREHYEAAGRREGRILPVIATDEPDVPPESYYFMFRNLRLEGFTPP
ncbi:MAG: hypothetical protein KF897_11350 [Opitutaceae bacterium]|nr:hypothetical protein [Opitutaceae bacterium]